MNQNSNWLSTLLRYADGQKRNLILSVLLSVISITAGLVPYYCVYRIVALFAEGQARSGPIFRWCAVVVGCYAGKVLFFSLSTGLSHHAAYHVVAGLRRQIAERFLRAPLGEVQKYSIGAIKNILVDKTESVEPPLAHMVPEGAGHLLLPVISLLALLAVDWRLALAALVTLPGAVVCMILTFRISGESFQKYNDSNAYMSSTIVEYVEGIEVIKAFGRAGVSYEKYSSSIETYKTFVIRWMASTWITMKLAFALMPSTLLGTLPVALSLANSGRISTAEAALAVMLSMSMVTSLARLEVYSESIRQMQDTVEELEEYLSLPELPQPDAPVRLDSYAVSMNQVRFSYDGTEEGEVLHGIDLELRTGSVTALVGPSGSGKSTIAKLLARFWDVGSGSITIGGVDIRQIPLEQLCDTVSFVTQDNYLFRCSLMENIRMGRPGATDEEVKDAARAARCEEFIARLPQGYDTPAGEAGRRLSGGEKQRIAIARMILKNAPIVILDEATAFTDPENEDQIQQSLAKLTAGKTLLVIAHRLSTIRNADRIVVLDHGRIAAQGDQESLLADCPLYRQMWQAHIGARHWAVSVSADARKEV